MRISRTMKAAGAATALVALLAGCASTGGTEPTTEESEAALEINQELHDALPQEILDAGEITAAANVWAPWNFYEEDGQTPQGASFDVAEALSQVLGVDVSIELTPGFADVATGMQSGRFNLGFGPSADTTTLQETYDFVDWVQEFVVFAVQPGNPTELVGLSNVCGVSVAVLAAGSAERVINERSAECEADGEDAVTIQSYADGNQAVLAVRSGRADAYFASEANLNYFISQSPDELELAGTDEANGFPELRQGSFFLKDDTELRDVWLAALQQLKDEGVLSEILERWNISNNELPEFGINLAG